MAVGLATSANASKQEQASAVSEPKPMVHDHAQARSSMIPSVSDFATTWARV
jgi:hypothetical protein